MLLSSTKYDATILQGKRTRIVEEKALGVKQKRHPLDARGVNLHPPTHPSIMSAKMKEYRYYLSSGVSTSISIKVSFLELIPAIELGVDGVRDEELSLPVDQQLRDLKLTPPSCNASAARAPSAFVSHGLKQLAGTTSELRNSTMKEFFISAQIYSDGLPMHPMVIR